MSSPSTSVKLDTSEGASSVPKTTSSKLETSASDPSYSHSDTMSSTSDALAVGDETSDKKEDQAIHSRSFSTFETINASELSLGLSTKSSGHRPSVWNRARHYVSRRLHHRKKQASKIMDGDNKSTCSFSSWCTVGHDLPTSDSQSPHIPACHDSSHEFNVPVEQRLRDGAQIAAECSKVVEGHNNHVENNSGVVNSAEKMTMSREQVRTDECSEDDSSSDADSVQDGWSSEEDESFEVIGGHGKKEQEVPEHPFYHPRIHCLYDARYDWRSNWQVKGTVA